MDKNKFIYCTLLLIDEYNHSRIFISEKNRYYIRRDNKSIHIQILNEFKDIRKSYGINVYDTTDNYYKIYDTTDNYYEIDKPYILKYCTISLIDKDDHSKMFLSEKNLYYICNDFDNDYDVDGYDYFDNNYGDYDYYYCDDYDDDYDYYYHDDDDYYYDNDYDKLMYYKKPLNYFERLVSVKNNIVNSSNNDDYNQAITLIINNCRIYIS